MPGKFHDLLIKEKSRIFPNLAIVFGVVLAASLFGILTRPMGFLAAFWPANAILIGMMARHPALSTPFGWVAAFAGYVAADMMTGSAPVVTLWLTLANMAGAATAYLLLMRLRLADRRLEHPASVVYLFVICVAAAGVAALAGAAASMLVFDRDPFTGFAFWFATELVNMIVVLPVILTSPPIRSWRLPVPLRRRWDHSLPAIVLAASVAGALVVGGPGAFAYPVPALLWCALSYSLFSTSILVLGFSIVQLVALSAGYLSVPADGDRLMTDVSIRLAIALIALGPLAVASINAAREKLVRRLRHTANHDGLTGALTRGAFLEQARRKLDAPASHDVRAAVLMLDVDSFKSFNDRYGHAVGDRVLAEAAQAIRTGLRAEDIFGRLGGEEFAILLTALSPQEAHDAAERIRARVERLTFEAASIEAGEAELRITVSIGLASRTDAGRDLRELLIAADRAVYEAKSGGRNRIVVADAPAQRKPGRTAA